MVQNELIFELVALSCKVPIAPWLFTCQKITEVKRVKYVTVIYTKFVLCTRWIMSASIVFYKCANTIFPRGLATRKVSVCLSVSPSVKRYASYY